MGAKRKRKTSEAIVARKPSGYFSNSRAETIALLSAPLDRVLDVGCGAGGAGPAFRAAGATELVGIEIDADQARQAELSYDEVLCGEALEILDDVAWADRFDTIACYDVLEHLVDPLSVLKALRSACEHGTRLHVSVPNARHFSLFSDLYVKGTFGYTQTGHRDLTHLRWFTRRDIESLIEIAGWQVISASPALPGRASLVDRLTLGKAQELIAFQWRILALAS